MFERDHPGQYPVEYLDNGLVIEQSDWLVPVIDFLDYEEKITLSRMTQIQVK